MKKNIAEMLGDAILDIEEDEDGPNIVFRSAASDPHNDQANR